MNVLDAYGMVSKATEMCVYVCVCVCVCVCFFLKERGKEGQPFRYKLR